MRLSSLRFALRLHLSHSTVWIPWRTRIFQVLLLSGIQFLSLLLKWCWFCCNILDIYLSSWSRVTARYDVYLTSPNVTSQSSYSFWGGSFLVEKHTTLHFDGLKSICHLYCHCSNLHQSSWILFPSVALEIIPYDRASSANSLTGEFKPSGRSFISNKNRNRPKTVPWGTPDVTQEGDDVFFSQITDCCRPVKNVIIHYATSH